MKRITLRPRALVAGVLVATLLAPAGPAAAAGTLCVGPGPGCFATLQAAIDAARDGATIAIAPGTFAGGITITKSIDLIGAGAGATIIQGGGPVVTIGEFLSPKRPTVTISAVTITGGLTTSSPYSQAFRGADNVIALGGGIEINPSVAYSTGASVTITDSVITRNTAAPTATVPSRRATCPGGPCPFAWAKGGGIDTWGRLRLRNTTVSHNTAGDTGVASDADGGGIQVWSSGTLILTSSQVVGNRAIASVPNGRFAEGGIFTEPGSSLTITGSVISDNTASLTSTFPFNVGGGVTLDMNANGGGIHAGDGTTIAIDQTQLNGNTVSVDDPNGEPYAFDAALHPGSGALSLQNSTLANNRVLATVASTADVGPSGSALDLNGPSTLRHVTITGNSTQVTTQAGKAEANGAVYSGARAAVLSDSVIRGNTVTATSTRGFASVQGAGLVNDGVLDLRNDLIADNTGTATAPAGWVQGGGIWNGQQFNALPFPHTLTLENTMVSGNVLRASPGLAVQGGGLFTAFPVQLDHSQIVNNTPDQCYGC